MKACSQTTASWGWEVPISVRMTCGNSSCNSYKEWGPAMAVVNYALVFWCLDIFSSLPLQKDRFCLVMACNMAPACPTLIVELERRATRWQGALREQSPGAKELQGKDENQYNEQSFIIAFWIVAIWQKNTLYLWLSASMGTIHLYWYLSLYKCLNVLFELPYNKIEQRMPSTNSLMNLETKALHKNVDKLNLEDY